MDFYKNLVNGKYNTYEKTASVNGDVVKDALSELSTGQLDALAEELDIFSKEASEITLESSLFEEDEYISYEIGKEAEEVEETEVEEVTEGHEDPAGEPGDMYTKEGEEDIEVEASEDEEFEIVKEACEQVGEYLVDNDLTVADYVYSLTGLEKHASQIGDMAEKVAMVYDIPVVMAARDLVSTMISLTDED